MSIYDHDTTTVKGVSRLHSVLQRDWICSQCGSRLATRWFDDAPNWRTVCVNDPGHEPDGFIHNASWAYVEARAQMDSLQAREVLSHLPPELQAAIDTERS